MEKLLTLGIDPWAIIFYIGNTGIVVIILTYLIYKPVIRILDKRRDMIANSIDEAQNLQEAFEKKVAETEAKQKQTEAELKEELRKLEKYIETKRAELVAEMEQARSEAMERAHKEIEERKSNMINEAEGEVKALMTRIILDIVENKVPEDVIQGSINSAWKKY